LDLEKKYELARREEENQRLKEQTAQQDLALLQAKQSRNFLLFGGVVVLLLLSLLYAALYLRQQKRLATEKQELEKQRFRLVLQGEEKERIRLARELHDGLGQMLAAAKLQLGLAARGDAHSFQKAQQLLEETVLEVRNISHNLVPLSLASNGLKTALRQLFDRIEAPGKLEMEVHLEADFNRFNTFGQTAIYRIVQEILHNMVKHAEASRIVIDIQEDGGELLLSIADNGKGFDTQLIQQSKGMGWENLYTRVGLLDGQLEVNSKPGRGTLVFAGIPIPAVEVAA
jgi:signal transduction histidine kinase